jgi:hypothetical protein
MRHYLKGTMGTQRGHKGDIDAIITPKLPEARHKDARIQGQSEKNNNRTWILMPM